MRTTVDLDPDLLDQLRVEAARRHVSFKALLNATVRSGLRARPREQTASYVLKPRRLGRVREGVNLDKALAVASTLEEHEVTREIERRK